MGNIYEVKNGEQNPLAMNSGGLSPRAKTIFWGIFLASLLPRIYFFRPGLWAWDSGEFAVAVRDLIFPHAPYLGYLALGILFKHLLPLPLDTTLSVLSLVSGSLVVLPFFYMARRLFKRENTALIATFLFAFAPTLVNQSGYQEIYSTQCLFVVASFALLLVRPGYGFWLAALAFGISLTVNIADVFLLPFFLAFMVIRRESAARALAWFSLAFGVEAAAFFWSYLVLGPAAALDYWFMDNITLLSRSLGPEAGIRPGVLVNGVGQMGWVVSKLSSLFNSLFGSLTPFLAVAGAAGFFLLMRSNRTWAALLGAFVLPYLLFDVYFPMRAVGLYLTFYLPAMALSAAALLDWYVEGDKTAGFRKGVCFIVFLPLFLFQSLVSPALPGSSSPEGFLYGLHGYLRWVNHVTTEKSLLVTEREPWITMFYSDRAVVYSSFLDEWEKGMTFFPKDPKMPTANASRKIELAEVADYLKRGTPVYTTTLAPFSGFKPSESWEGRFMHADLYHNYIERTPVVETVTEDLYEDFFTETFRGDAFEIKDVEWQRDGGFIHPSAYDRTGSVTYALEYPGEIERMWLDLDMVISHPENSIKVYVLNRDFEPVSIRTFAATPSEDVVVANMDLTEHLKGRSAAFIRIELFVDDSSGLALISARLRELRVKTIYRTVVKRTFPLYRVSLFNLYVQDDFTSDGFREKSLAYENLSRDGDGYVYPSSYNTPAQLHYRIEAGSDFKRLMMDARFYAMGERSVVEVFASADGKDYSRIYALRGDAQGKSEEPLIDIVREGSGMKTHVMFVKILLYRGGDEERPLIDSRLEKLIIYGEGV